MISREEAIRILSRYDNEHYRPKTRQAHRMGAEALREQEKRRWIPVTERLPADWVPVLVVLRDIEKPSIGSYRDNVWFWEKFGTAFLNGAVTHWMPLPEAPRS